MTAITTPPVVGIVLAATNHWTARPWTRPEMGGSWLMTYTTGGSGGRYRVGPLQLRCAAGDVFLVHREVALENSVAEDERWDYHVVRFDASPGWIPSPPFEPLTTDVYRVQVRLVHTRQRIEDAFRRLIADVRARDATEALTDLQAKSRRGNASTDAYGELGIAALREIVLLLHIDATEAARLDPRIVGALQVITGDLAGDHDVRALARLAGLSTSRFLQLFRQQVGIPPRRAIRTLRLQQAALKLAYGNDPVGAIADDTGFSSIFDLSRTFRRVYGISPRAYRERARTPALPSPPKVRQRLQR